MLYRCYAQGPGGVESGSLLEDELAARMWGPGGEMAQILAAQAAESGEQAPESGANGGFGGANPAEPPESAPEGA